MNYDLEKLRETDQINDYFYNKLKKSWLFMNSDLHDDFGEFMQDIMMMSQFGVSSKEDELAFRRIQHDVPEIATEIVEDGFHLTDYYVHELMKEMYDNKDKYDMSNLLSVFCSVAKAAQAVGIPLSEKANDSCFIGKLAYPNHQTGSHMKQTYDISKWIDATKDIYSRMYRLGMPYSVAFEHVTGNWDKMETLDYKHWLRFYTEGVPAKYPKLAGQALRKSAQGYVSDNGFYLPTASLLERHHAEDVPKPKPEPDKNEVRDRIESQRSRILSRLSSAEKLLTSLEGQHFAGDEQEFMLKLLQDLKRKVQTANKMSIHSSLFEDFIYRAANYMGAHGSRNGKAFFHKIAQMDPFAGAMPPVDEAVPEQETIGDPVEDTRNAFREMKEMAQNLNQSGVLFFDSDDDPDERAEIKKRKETSSAPEVAPPAPVAEPLMPPMPKGASIAAWAIKQASVVIKEFNALHSSIVVFAQAAPVMPEEDIPIGAAESAPPAPPRARPKLAPEPEEEITVIEDDVNPDGTTGPEDKTGDIIDEALEQVTVHDAINLLEMLVAIYKQREVPRQLSKLDMVMDRLGLAAYFPQLGEAQSKALDSTQYVSTRLEDILGKLRGSIESSEGESWVEKKKETDPETQTVQNNLEIKQNQEEEKREMRKQKADEKLMDNDKKEVGQQAEKELAGPTAVETGTPVQVR